MAALLALKALVVWVIILCVAFSNAALRELVLIPRLGKVRGLTISGVILCLLIPLIAYGCLPWLGVKGKTELLAIGLGWLALTLAFDLSLGWIQGKPVYELLKSYLFKGGNLWPLVLLVTAAAPYLAARLHGWV
jgi:hypothetical protein